jgi:hypothetical protein
MVNIVANNFHTVEALTAASVDSLDPATLCNSYENAINLTRAPHSSGNLAD